MVDRMSGSQTKISITGKLTYSEDITISQAAKIIEYLDSCSSETEVGGSGGLLLGGSTKKLAVKKAANPRDALELSGAQKNPEKIAALAAYVLQDSSGTFKPVDVKTAFRRAHEAPPANFPRDLNLAIAAGWVCEDEVVAGDYYLTNKLDGIFDGGFVFPKPSSNGGSRGRAAKKSSTKGAKPETLAEIDEFYSTMEGYPPYSKLKNEKDRLLWVAAYMREKHARNGTTNKEIAWISDHIGAGVPSNNIGGAFNMAKKPGYAIRSTLDNEIRVTDEGVAHLKSLATVS
jgi:hypothetical protein